LLMVLRVSMTSMRKMLSVFSRSFAASWRSSLARALGSSAAQAGLRGLGGRDRAIDVGGGRGRHVAERLFIAGLTIPAIRPLRSAPAAADQHVAAHEIGMDVHWAILIL